MTIFFRKLKILKKSHLLLGVILLFLFNVLNVNSQTKDKEQDTISKNEIYSKSEEKYMQNWFSDNVEEMTLTKYKEAEYYKILHNHILEINQLSRLEEKKNSKNEIKEELNNIVKSMNIKMKMLLTKKQFDIHYKTFDKILWNVYVRKGWN
ncbi:hypothetical protein [uncultured Algibacter sp.]|uniref:hypothetical protein n=1 Tax=uncultured Algibacter sp. TaxID=298659 RepID=UPI00263631AE|nr:hypothetical protein [uncultured Algibacter sp.]